jgi:hypothetical protein
LEGKNLIRSIAFDLPGSRIASRITQVIVAARVIFICISTAIRKFFLASTTRSPSALPLIANSSARKFFRLPKIWEAQIPNSSDLPNTWEMFNCRGEINDNKLRLRLTAPFLLGYTPDVFDEVIVGARLNLHQKNNIKK